ncbi:hypothetical protein Pflav_058600 [Phytohabitans flavus]|uniref:Squalene cyclase C-terminal domain-containing protein n=1 Tax=Phytohabitans flavus TaxID=1076124 RepID=A0A6F8Y060_9ACTN|nr:hypothetical protein Pflav_058600 [Phytohabitans flavus]
MEVAFAPIDVVAAARELVAGLRIHPWGRVSTSVYETGRLVALAPWLRGHRERVTYLMGGQREDGGWGGPDGYALVPTLSATDALLPEAGGAAAAADRGVAVLHSWLRGPVSLPDMPAIELIIPALVESINARLHRHGRMPLPLPPEADGSALARLRAVLAAGRAVPEKLMHAWEVVHPFSLHERVDGPIGASPAATAAWLGNGGAPAVDDPGRRYLEAVADRYGGPVPCAAPITVFERAWVLSWLAEAGVPLAVPESLLRELDVAVGPTGTPAGRGLPQDADTTAMALSALAQLGAVREPDSLWAYETGTHFCTWQGEDGRSVSVNAHVLEAFGHYLRTGPERASRYADATRRLTTWLADQQDPDGSWLDRWHASPFYATACCALALDRFGEGPAARVAVDRAVDWVLDTQRPDGSWGCGRAQARKPGTRCVFCLLVRMVAQKVRLCVATRMFHAHFKASRSTDQVIHRCGTTKISICRKRSFEPPCSPRYTRHNAISHDRRYTFRSVRCRPRGLRDHSRRC